MKNFTYVMLMLSVLFVATPLRAIDKQMLNQEVSVTMGDLAQEVTIGDVLSMSAKEYAAYTGQKLSLKEKVGYGLMKGQMKRAVKKGTVSKSDSATAALVASGGSFNFGAFLLGFFFGLLGLLVVALAFNDKKAWVSALIGMGALIVVYVLLLA